MNDRANGVFVLNGSEAERYAETFLRHHNLVLLQRNYRCRSGEIDLIMRDGTTLVFVEVRMRSSPAFGGADLSDLMVTTAWEGLDPGARRADPQAGCTFVTAVAARGLPEPRVLLP